MPPPPPPPPPPAAPSPPPCDDSEDWANFLQDSCVTYATKRWCHGGRVLNASLAGSFYAYPERACCACGRATFASSPAERALSEVVLLATHSVDVTDARIWRHYGDDLRRSMPSAALWLLLFREVPWASTALTAWERGRLEQAAYEQRSWQKVHRLDVAIWSNLDLARVYPALRDAVQAGAGGLALEPSEHVRRYYWFHASLGLWLHCYGPVMPGVRRLWRVEPDVVLVAPAPLSPLLLAGARSDADVLLPHTTDQATTDQGHFSSYPHFGRMAALLAPFPPERRVWALVSIGRYSTTYLRRLARDYWAKGVLGYEEVTLPTLCLNDVGNCSVRELSRGRDGINVDTHHVTWKPNGFEWKCEQFVDTVRKGTKDPELWHPLKQRECYLEFLDAATEGRVDQLKAWEGPKHCAGWCHWSIDDNCVLEAKKSHCVDCDRCVELATQSKSPVRE